jgi:hypothetical protein
VHYRRVQTAPWFLRVLFIAACVALVGAVASIVLLFFKRPVLARWIAKRATLLGAVVLGVAIAELQVLWLAPERVLPPGDPSGKVRALAEGISEIVNCSALALPAVVLGGLGWIVARGQVKRSTAATRA